MMDWGSPELTNVLLAVMGFGWTIYGIKLEKRITRLEWWHGQHHPSEKAHEH